MSDAQTPLQVDDSASKRGELAMRVASAVALGIAAIATAWLGGIVFLAFWAAGALAVWWEWVLSLIHI